MENEREISKYNIKIVKESKKQSYPLSIILPVFNVEKYLENNDNITYIVKDNGGLSHARNVRIYVYKR